MGGDQPIEDCSWRGILKTGWYALQLVPERRVEGEVSHNLYPGLCGGCTESLHTVSTLALQWSGLIGGGGEGGEGGRGEGGRGGGGEGVGS